MDFFDIHISLHARSRELTLLQRLQIEILHAVALRHKLIIVADINGKLRLGERHKLGKFYEQLIRTIMDGDRIRCLSDRVCESYFPE